VYRGESEEWGEREHWQRHEGGHYRGGERDDNRASMREHRGRDRREHGEGKEGGGGGAGGSADYQQGRDPLLVVNILKDREKREAVGGRRQEVLTKKKTQKNVYELNHEVASSDSDLEADHLQVRRYPQVVSGQPPPPPPPHTHTHTHTSTWFILIRFWGLGGRTDYLNSTTKRTWACTLSILLSPLPLSLLLPLMSIAFPQTKP
jgi:hypothetical protein